MDQNKRADAPGSESALKICEQTKNNETGSKAQEANFANAVGQRIDGGRQASRFLFLLSREYQDPEALHLELVRSRQIGMEHHIGFARALQKALERAIGAR